MRKIIFKNKWYLLFMLILIIADPTINAILNFWVQRLFNAAAPNGNKVFVMRLLTQGFLLWILKRLVSFSSGTLKARYICKTKQDLKHRMFERIMNMNTSNLAEIASSGEYISLFTNDINLIEQRFFNQIIGLISSIVSILIMGSSFIALNSTLAIAIILFGICTMFVPTLFSNRLNRKNILYSKTVSTFTQRLKEYIVAYPTIKNYAIIGKIVDKFSNVNNATEDTKFESDYELNLANNVGQLIAWFMQFIGVGLGLMMVVNGQIMIGTVIAAQSFASDLASPLQNLVININSIRSVKQIVKRINSLSNEEQHTEENKDTNIPSQRTELKNYDMVFDSISLSVAGQDILKEFSFVFEQGKKYLIVGKNGSGKSSIFKVLKKWFNNVDGRITIGGIDIRQLSDEDSSKTVSYLNENVSMFSGNVRDNIVLFSDANDEQFVRAVKDARVEINLNKEIGDEGRNISSGEQRRIEIARSLFASAHILIFDEVVSTLDVETAYDIEDLVLSYRDKTVIFVSHNFSGKLISKYDEILVMDRGELVAHGNCSYLLSHSAYFRKICDIKFGCLENLSDS